MKRRIWIGMLVLIMMMIVVPHAAAEGTMDAIHDAGDAMELMTILREIPELSDEIARYDALDWEQRNNVRTGLYIRRKNPQSMEEFKVYFTEKMAEATTYMQFAEGYPKVQDNGTHGMTLTVKTDISGYIYIVAFPDAVEGGISDARQFMEFYEKENGLYKKKVYLEGGQEYTFPVSCGTHRRGGQYRAYMLLRVNNCYSQFQQVKYTVKELTYVLYRIAQTYYNAPDDIDADIDLWSNRAHTHWTLDGAYYYDADGNLLNSVGPFDNHTPYTDVRTYQFMASADMTPPAVRMVVYTTFHLTDGSRYSNSFTLILEDEELHLHTHN